VVWSRDSRSLTMTKKKIESLSRKELIKECKRLEFTVKSRGRRLGSLYHVIQMMITTSPNRVEVQSVQSLEQQIKDAIPPTTIDGGGDALSKCDCIVCFESFNQDTRRPIAISCGHIYCTTCIVKHQEGKTVAHCPQCRKPFTSFLSLYF